MTPTPTEKATELVDKYRTIIRKADCYENLPVEDEIQLAKECAKIVVEELIKETDWSETNDWEKVKTETEKL